MVVTELYHSPALSGPQLEDFRRLNEELKLRCSEEDLEGMATEGKLSGRTVGIKDNTAVAGVPMRNGSKILENYVPEFDATVVTRILDAGGRIIGKTSVEDMCSSGSSITNSDGPVIAGYDDGRDPRQFPGMTVPQYSKLIEASVSGKRDLPPAVKFHALYSEYMTQLYGRANKFYAKANNLKMELTRQYDAALQKFDVLVMPTMPFVAPKIPPAGISYLGMMIVGKKFDDVTVLQMARAVETIAPKDKKLSEVMGELTANFQRVSEIPDPSIPRVRYPRTPGHRPTPEENPYNAWAWRCDIRGAAEGKLSGRTVGIKDNIAVAGVPMRNGSKLLENYVPEFDATVVTKILDAGNFTLHVDFVLLLTLGKSVSLMSRQRPLVAAGLADLAVGGDQGGSVRIPASFMGIVGFKPTFGLVPATGTMGMEPTLDHVGPMARTVTDCALLLEVIAGYDGGRDARQIPNMSVPEYSKLVDVSVAGKKVGLLKEGFDVCTEEAVKTVVRQAASRLTQAGITLREASVPMHKDGPAIYSVCSGFYGTYQCMFKNSGVGLFNKGFYPTSLQEAFFRGYTTHPHDTPPAVKFLAMVAEYIDRLYGNKFYGKGHNLVLELTRQFDEALEEFDVLILPTLPYTATKLPTPDWSFEGLYRSLYSMVSNTLSFDSTGHPALSINAGFVPTPEGTQLPVGMMIVGKKFDEVTVLQVARAFEKLSE
nr:hypothetical protein BaRGS_029106 [Batillaria attramentaria]